MKKIALNERVALAGGCGHAAEDHTHEHDGSVGGGCCSGAADHAHLTHEHAKGCCRSSSADKDKGPQP